MKSLLDWLDDRTGYRHFVRDALYEHIPGGARWRYVWGSTLVFAFATQVITGLFLWAAYSPSSRTAWESVYYIQYEMQGGWLLRGVHHFMAQAMVVLMALHLLQVVVDGAYRAPREINFWLGLVLMQIVLGLALTGYLLPWDQKGYWATHVATELMDGVPLVGEWMKRILVGGSDYGHHTLTRFFALHAGFLPIALVAFLVLHVYLFRRHGLCAKQPYKQPDCTFWPEQVLRDAVACLAVLAVVLLMILLPAISPGFSFDSDRLGAELMAPADPADQYRAARPEWYFLFLFQFLKYFPGHLEIVGALVVPGLVMLVLLLMPFIGRWRLGHRFNVAFLLALLVGVGALTWIAVDEDYRAAWTDPERFADVAKTEAEVGSDEGKLSSHFQGDAAKIADYRQQLLEFEHFRHSEEYLKDVQQARRDAERVRELAAGKQRIPVEGAIALLRADALTQGPRLFATYCASCHVYQPQGTAAEPGAEAPTAPNLYRFASREWIAGLLNPEQIAGPGYFGNTEHKEGDMVGFVTGDLADWSKEEIENVVIALSAEARLPYQAAADKKDQDRIAAGVALIKDEDRCAQCHKFHDAGEEGSAPDLTGYGSQAWLAGMIGQPGAAQFYGENNDRMPAFAEHPSEPHKNILAAAQIGMLADWLRSAPRNGAEHAAAAAETATAQSDGASQAAE